MKARPQKPDVQFLGELTLATLIKGFRFGIFRAGRKEPSDEYQLGWRLVKPNDPIVVAFRTLRFATAEGINAAAAMWEALGGDAKEKLVRFEFDEASSGLAQALEFARKSPAIGVQPLTRTSAQAWHCGPFVCNVEKEMDVLAAARNIAESAVLAAADWSSEDQGLFHDAIERIALEALYNVHEHAFKSVAAPPRAFICLSVQPAERCLGGMDAQAPSERQWLEEQGQRLVFEMAVSDAGKGIPRSLWLKARDRRPEVFETIRSLGSGTNAFDRCRARLHEHLTADSFRHDSSCKDASAFADEYHAMNWRGLYRCRQQVSDFGGFIAVASGRGRAGYANLRDDVPEFSYALPKGNDLPGTTVVVRIALPLKRCGPSHQPRPVTEVERSTASVFSPKLVPWMALTRKGTDFQHESETKELQPFEVGIVFPFNQISSDNHLLLRDPSRVSVPKLLEQLKKIPPELVPIIFFADLGEDTLRALGPSWTPLSGYPRLTAFWKPQQGQLSWRVAGVFHPDTEKMLRTLEYAGKFQIPPDSPPSVSSLAQELATNYPRFITFDRLTGGIQLTQFAARIPDEVERSAFQLAFQEAWPELRTKAITEDPVRNILLHTGTRVRRYLCILSLAESSILLSESLGRQIVEAVSRPHDEPSCQLVTDDHGSSFVAKTLLRNQSSNIALIQREQALELPPGSEVVLFVDAVFKGRTVGNLAGVLQERGLRVRSILTCADLREHSGSKMSDSICVSSLLEIPLDFRPEEVATKAPWGGEIQIDRVTHMPVDAEASRFAELYTTNSARKLMQTEPELFDHGFHERGGRLHTITMPAGRLLERHPVEGIACVVDKLAPFLAANAPMNTDVAFFYRSDSAIGRYIGKIHGVLIGQKLVGLGNSFQVSMPIEHRGAKTVFVHADLGLFTNCKPVETGQLALLQVGDSRNVPHTGFVAIYLDDAAVSGKALRSFLHHVMREPQRRPRAVIGVVLVNRLSPAEMRAFDLWRRLWPAHEDISGSGVPFCFDGVFRLQVRSREGGSPLSHPLLRRIRSSGPIPARELRSYLQDITHRAANERPLRHIFLPPSEIATEQPLSSDAAQLRHLLSLHQQNEPVAAEILSVFTRLRNAKDSSLLHLLALEPELLDEVPFNGICQQDAIGWCVDTLRDTNASRCDKSAALTVLASYEIAFFERLREIAPGILGDDFLRRQLLLFLLTLFTRTYTQYHRVKEVLTDVREPAEECAWAISARDLIDRSHRFRETLARIRTEDDAELLLRDLIGRMSRHSTDSEEHWESVSNQLMTMRADWNSFADEKARNFIYHNVPRALHLATNTFLPSLSALIFLSELRGDNELAESTRNSYETASLSITRLGGIAPKSAEDVTQETVGVLCDKLEELRTATWAGGWSSNDILSKADIGGGLAPLCSGLREFYSAPWAIFARLADENRAHRAQATLRVSIEPHFVVAPVPVVEMFGILRPLFNNVLDHGEFGTLQLSKQDAAPPLVIAFSNTVSKPAQAGGVGVALAKAKAAPFKLTIDSRPRSESEWLTEITFPHFFRADGIHNHS